MQIYKTAQGRSSIFLAIKALARKKKYILTQAFTCVAVPEAIISAGYVPFWLDIELETFSIELDNLYLAFKKNPNQFGALLIQHTFGLTPKYYKELKNFANNKNIPIIEDRCHCNFVKNYNDLQKNIKHEKIAYCYSFENAKPINLGRGGLLLVSEFSEEETITIEKEFKTFKKNGIFKSLMHLTIAISYSFFYKTIFYWRILEGYRKLASFGIMPSNFKKFPDEFVLEKMGFSQEFIISLLIFISRKSMKLFNQPILAPLIKKISKNFLIEKKRIPIYVKNKKKAMSFCKKKNISVKDYFNTPIQPLTFGDYKLVNYKKNLCLKAEEASRHIISFDKIPPKIFLIEIQN
tara:strand:+ start:107 stop:1156 length:1050 start_codon:yes stop_codon:yes gene_type:complete